MGLTLNGKNPESITIGGKAVASLSINGDVVWPEILSEPNYFYVDLGSGTASSEYIVLKKVGSPTTGSDIQYGIWYPEIPPSGRIWWTNVVFDSNNECIIEKGSLSSGGKIYFRSTTGWSTDSNSKYYYFSEASRSFNVGGDLRTLLDYTDPSLNTAQSHCFSYLFINNSKIKRASDLDLSYISNLNTSCYSGMFYNCTSLTQAPTLPATTLAAACYYYMFYNCTSLTQAPTLPATTLVTTCYRGMFYNCTSLNKVITYAQDISASACTTEWLKNVSSTGDFYNLGGATYRSGVSGIPSGWTVHTSL